MLATVKQIKNVVRSTGADLRTVWGRTSWTDKRRTADAAANERYVVYKFGSDREADMVADELRQFYKLAGVTAKVTRTSTHSDWSSRSTGGEYVRTIGVM